MCHCQTPFRLWELYLRNRMRSGDFPVPLRDHFRPPLSKRRSWEGFHGCWPMTITQQLNAKLPLEFAAEPRVQLGAAFDVEDSSSKNERDQPWPLSTSEDGGGVTTMAWAPPMPTVLVDRDLPKPSEYEVLVSIVSWPNISAGLCRTFKTPSTRPGFSVAVAGSDGASKPGRTSW